MHVPSAGDLRPDRFVEVDLDWFTPDDPSAIELFVERVAPLWSGNRPERGVVLNTGFLVDIITEFAGSLDQHLPLRSARYERWRTQRYQDLADLVDALRAAASQRGITDLRVGILVAGIGRVVTGSDLYDLHSDWCDRHPELYPFDLSPLPGPDLDPRVPLAGDRHRYAAFPDGIAAGTPFGAFMAAQWRALSTACRLDVIHLRDGFWGPMLYTRKGPYGVVASDDATQNASWTIAIRDLFAAIKHAQPGATVMAYTSGIGATAELRSGCIDTDEVLRGGGVDVLIDQTWGGAWQDWWDDWWKGWTNQHANLLSHGVAVRRSGTQVRHYKLIETWDGWEPFDTVHAVPEKLRWAIWAWSHAAIVTPSGLEVPDGSYVSWMNDRDRRLLDAAAIDFVASELGAAEDDAAKMTAVRGPLLAFDHAAVAAHHALAPRTSVSEHLEDAAALAMKWGMPILGATDVRWLGAIDATDGVVVQLGSDATIATPATVVGRADCLVPAWSEAIGVHSTGTVRRSGFHREVFADPELPEHGWVHLSSQVDVDVDDRSTPLARASGWPTLVAGDRAAAWWQPPELSDPGNPLLPRSQYGSVASAMAVARWWSQQTGSVSVDPVDSHLPVTVQSWQCGDTVTVLAGNLETGWVGDSRTPRTAGVAVELNGCTERRRIVVPPEGCTIERIPICDDHDGPRRSHRSELT